MRVAPPASVPHSRLRSQRPPEAATHRLMHHWLQIRIAGCDHKGRQKQPQISMLMHSRLQICIAGCDHRGSQQQLKIRKQPNSTEILVRSSVLDHIWIHIWIVIWIRIWILYGSYMWIPCGSYMDPYKDPIWSHKRTPARILYGLH